MSAKRRPTPLTPSERAAQLIRQFHALGKLVLARAVTNDKTIVDAAQFLASEQGVSYDRALKAARFTRLFDDRALERLDKLCEIYPLTINHIRRVLRVNSKTVRHRWLKRAADGRWQAGRLQREIQLATGDQPGAGGPQIRTPADPFEAIEQVSRRTAEWLKRYDAIWGLEATWSETGEIADQANLAQRLSECRGMLKRLQIRSAALEERLTRLERSAKRKGRKAEIVRPAGTRS
jgi:hypothetical protein